MISHALKILDEYKYLTVNQTKASAGYIHVVGKLSRVLTRSVSLVKSDLDPKLVWSKISQVKNIHNGMHCNANQTVVQKHSCMHNTQVQRKLTIVVQFLRGKMYAQIFPKGFIYTLPCIMFFSGLSMIFYAWQTWGSCQCTLTKQKFCKQEAAKRVLS